MENSFSLNSLTGQEVALQFLNSFLQNPSRTPHVLIFYGPDGVGKWTAAERFSRHFLCLSHSSCGVCESCLLFMRNRHPDFIQFPHASSIKIGEGEDPEPFTIRWLLAHRIPYRPHVSAKKIIIFPDASKILPASETALLKTLEEPPAHTYFILLVNDLSKLKQTVISRSVLIPFSYLQSNAIKQIANEKDVKYFPFWGGSLNPYDVEPEQIDEWQGIVQENCFDSLLLIKLENWVRDTLSDSKSWKDKLTSQDFLEIITLILLYEYRSNGVENHQRRISALLEFKSYLHKGIPALEPFLLSKLFSKLVLN